MNGLGLGSMIAAIVVIILWLVLIRATGLFLVTSVAALATGVIALRQIAASRGEQRGAGFAVTGIVLGGFEFGFLAGLLLDPYGLLALIGASIGLVAGIVTAVVLKPKRSARPLPSGPVPGSVIPETNGLAVSSMVLGIVGFSVLALIFGYVARGQIRRSQGTQRGDGFAVAGIVLGWVGLVVLCAAIVVIVLTVSAANDERHGAALLG